MDIADIKQVLVQLVGRGSSGTLEINYRVRCVYCNGELAARQFRHDPNCPIVQGRKLLDRITAEKFSSGEHRDDGPSEPPIGPNPEPAWPRGLSGGPW
jgi:hypothetical protein